MSPEPTLEQAADISPSFPIPNGKDAEESWVFIRDHMHKPFSSQNSQNVEEYIACYTAAVNFMECARQNRHKRVMEKFYSNIQVLLHSKIQAAVEHILSNTSEEIATFYISSWEPFLAVAKHNGRVLRYMNRHYVQRVRDEGATNVYPIEKLHTVCWKEDVLDKLGDELRKWLRNAEDSEERKVEREKLSACYEALEKELAGTNAAIPSFEEFSKKK